jgi:hypothetical protein
MRDMDTKLPPKKSYAQQAALPPPAPRVAGDAAKGAGPARTPHGGQAPYSKTDQMDSDDHGRGMRPLLHANLGSAGVSAPLGKGVSARGSQSAGVMSSSVAKRSQGHARPEQVQIARASHGGESVKTSARVSSLDKASRQMEEKHGGISVSGDAKSKPAERGQPKYLNHGENPTPRASWGHINRSVHAKKHGEDSIASTQELMRSTVSAELPGFRDKFGKDVHRLNTETHQAGVATKSQDIKTGYVLSTERWDRLADVNIMNKTERSVAELGQTESLLPASNRTARDDVLEDPTGKTTNRSFRPFVPKKDPEET